MKSARFQSLSFATMVATFLMLVSCKPGTESTKAIPSDAKPGPVENIDESERLAAIDLEPAIDDVTREVKRFSASVRSDFESEKFAQLDELAATLTSGNDTFGDGTWKIDQFYDAIENRFNNTDAGWLTDLELHKKWLTAAPKSVAAHTALANFWTTYAWRARGSGYADTVTEQQWQTFAARLNEAAKVLEAISDTQITDPAYYSAAMTLALGSGWPADQFDQLVTSALEVNPAYWPIVHQRAYSLLPRWYGKEGEWETFVAETCAKSRDLGPAAYTQIVIRMRRFYASIFRDSKASWPETLKGIQILQSEYPDSELLVNQFAFLATSAGDRSLAKAMFDRMGNRYFQSAWSGPEQVVHFRTWAETGQW